MKAPLAKSSCCIQWFKDTNLKANHNKSRMESLHSEAVFNGSKILIWKQITTRRSWRYPNCCCIQWFKDTNLKANHNKSRMESLHSEAVFNGSKILIWKQITTRRSWRYPNCCCIQWFKDTNLKANHNHFRYCYFVFLLYSMVQRY